MFCISFEQKGCVAQSAEQRNHNPLVGGSSPLTATIFNKAFFLGNSPFFLAFWHNLSSPDFKLSLLLFMFCLILATNGSISRRLLHCARRAL